MKSFDDLVYTYKHRKIVMFLARKYFGDNEELIKQVEDHDMDKMFLMLFFEKKQIKELHVSTSSHHDNDIPKTELDYMEMILDWESARYTKDDKPLNAFDTLEKYYPQLEGQILPILKRIGLDYSTLEKERDVLKYADSLGIPTVEDIRSELVDYVNFRFSKNKVRQKTIRS